MKAGLSVGYEIVKNGRLRGLEFKADQQKVFLNCACLIEVDTPVGLVAAEYDHLLTSLQAAGAD